MNRVITSPGSWEYCYMASGAVVAVCLTLAAVCGAEMIVVRFGHPIQFGFEAFAAMIVMLFYYALCGSQCEQELHQKYKDDSLELMLDSHHLCIITRAGAAAMSGLLLMSFWDTATLSRSIIFAVMVFLSATAFHFVSTAYLDGTKFAS